MIQSTEIGQLVAALIKAQGEFNPVLKQKNNPFFKSKYADLQAGIEATQPALTANGLIVTQFPVANADGVGVLSILAHTSGQFISESYVLPLSKKDPQTGVAAITYARRAAYLAIIGVAAEDDDGNKAAARDITETPKKPPRAEIPSELPSSKYVKSETKAEPLSLSLPDNSGEKPDPNQLEEYGKRVNKLGEFLKKDGMTDAGLPASRKIIAFLLKQAGTKDVAQISIPQFDAFLKFASSANPKSLVAMVEAGYR